ncbi:helix-turn-helix domain-containing protein [Subtercola vilae]|uniref:DNA-binding protein n=1 Tax=Subtercola vilae TaxID=2056433 RepID=A0A4T2BJS4_9MICO|nr:helix-turn-helix domain-containing protein [Subtercola vilae]TIH29288.1 DNA-binding protein [Subtercola vilae]
MIPVTASESASDAELAERALASLRHEIDGLPNDVASISLTIEHARKAVALPRQAVDALMIALGSIAAGHGVRVISIDDELTTQEAASILNVSRPFLIKLLDEGKIAYRKVGSHRRVRSDSLMRYKSADDERSKADADELIRLGQEMGS